MRKVGETESGTVLVEMFPEEWHTMQGTTTKRRQYPKVSEEQMEERAKRIDEWWSTEAFGVIKGNKNLKSTGVYRAIANAYTHGRFDGSLAELRAIAEGEILVRDVGPRRRELLKQALDAVERESSQLNGTSSQLNRQSRS